MLLLIYIYIYGSIVFHEAGHFVFCYVFKVPIKKVQIGYGKTIIKIGLFV
jgi:membrane-associated protease RseP (regulator of RpoE activity)